jgi:hypothetical protein
MGAGAPAHEQHAAIDAARAARRAHRLRRAAPHCTHAHARTAQAGVGGPSASAHDPMLSTGFGCAALWLCKR